MSELVKAIIRAIAEVRHPGKPLFMLTAEQPCPEARIQRGDVVVYIPVTPQPGQAVVWSSRTGRSAIGLVTRSGQVRYGGRWQRPVRFRGVIVAAIRSIPANRPAPPEPGGFD